MRRQKALLLPLSGREAQGREVDVRTTRDISFLAPDGGKHAHIDAEQTVCHSSYSSS